jgi:hypothetical protein
MSWGRLLRTVRSLHPLQIASRPYQAISSSMLVDLPSGAPPRVVERLPEPPAALRQFANSERERYKRRLDRLVEGSRLRSYETQYGLELGGDTQGPRPGWIGPDAVHAYPASIRARRISVAIRCGQTGLERELARAARAIVTQLEVHLMGNHLLENGFGLVCAASVTEGPEAAFWWWTGAALLSWQLEQQFLADGGHFELSASYHLALTAGLLEAIELRSASGKRVPELWREKAAAALRWAALVRAPDGTYPLFSDASLDSAPSIDQVVELGRACGVGTERPVPTGSDPWFCHLHSTGWLLAGTGDGSWLCVDAAADGASYQPGHAHADALTFELWIDGQRTIVDYGVSSYAVDTRRAETRATKSHNTVELDSRDSCEVWQAFRVGRRSRSRVTKVERSERALEIEVEHDGYAWLEGKPIHHRTIAFSSGLLRIADKVRGRVLYPGVSRLRFASEARSRIDVNSSDATTVHDGVWHPNFADPRDAVVLGQPLSRAGDSSWSLTWAPR